MKSTNAIISDELSFTKETPLSSSIKPKKLKLVKSEFQLSNNVLPKVQTNLRIRNYSIINEIGRGAYGTVYLAENELDNKLYAIKSEKKSFLQQANSSFEPIIERNMLMSLSNDAIIKLIMTFQTKEFIYFVLEYAPNSTLHDLLNYAPEIPFDFAKIYAKQIIDILYYLHEEKNIVHRDIKSSNILIDENYNLKLTDFSTARICNKKYNLKTKKFETPEKGNLDQEEDVIVGTPDFCSPEMYTKRNMYSKSNDIWSFGCILYQLFHRGHLPFHDDSQSKTKENILNCKYVIDDNLPEDLKDLFRKIFILDENSRITINDLKNHKFFLNIKSDLKEIICNNKLLCEYFGIYQCEYEDFEIDRRTTSSTDDLNQLEKIKEEDYSVEVYYAPDEIESMIKEDYFKPEKEEKNYTGMAYTKGFFGKKQYFYISIGKNTVHIKNNKIEKDISLGLDFRYDIDVVNNKITLNSGTDGQLSFFSTEGEIEKIKNTFTRFI